MSTSEVPSTMQAILYSRPAQTLELVSSWPVPQPNFAEDEHLLKVDSMSITKGELTWPRPPESDQDYSPGVEMCGTVAASPRGSKFLPGSKVYLRITFPRSAGGREYTIGLGQELAFQPRNITPEQAASVPVSALTAWQALFVQAGFDPTFNGTQSTRNPVGQQGERILIIGASGSVGLWTTQLARLAGFWVVGTSHTRNVKIVKDFGAHQVIDYTQASTRAWLDSNNARASFDLVLDCVGGKSSPEAWHAARPGGLVLSIVPSDDGVFKWHLDPPEGIDPSIKGRFFIMESIGTQLQLITELIEAGKLKPVVDSVFALKDHRKAFSRVDSGETTGKVVIKVQKSATVDV